MPIQRSDAQARLLVALLLHPDDEATLTQLATMSVSPSSAHHEVNRLTRAGLLRERRVGRNRMIRADTSSPYYSPLVQILARSYGPVAAIQRRLAELPEVESALIFGSYAARSDGHPGELPRDIDVPVIGEPPGRELRAPPPNSRQNSTSRSSSWL